MLLKILMKDLKKKKVMNIILSIFMLASSILMAGSTNLLYTTTTAVNYFMEKSNVADVISLLSSDKEASDTIWKWAKNSKIVKNADSENAILVDENKVTASTGKALKKTNMLVIMTKPNNFNLVFDKEGKDFQVNLSEAAVPVSIQKKMGLSIGDSITMEINNHQKKFTVSYIFKDAVFGADLMGMKRIIINEQDFNNFYKASADSDHFTIWEFSKNPGYENKNLERGFTNLSLTSDIITKSYISSVYAMNMILAVIMMLVNIFLILISFLILRFTITFTMTEDYKQIGIMKAIGLNNKKIKGMYLVKYLTLSIITGTIGFIASFPISSLMKQSISEYILLNQSPLVLIITLASIVAVVGGNTLFCSSCINKIKRISVIEAIRQGSSGERFTNSKKLKLSHLRKMNVPLFLACSDIISDTKKYFVLIITFILGTAIVIIPNNVITTLCSNNTITVCGFSDSNFYLPEDYQGNQEDAINYINNLEDKFREKGIETKLKADFVTSGSICPSDQSEKVNVMVFQAIGTKTNEFVYLDGTAPKLLNEIAITEKVAEALGVHIGSNVICDIQGEKKNFIITALFQSLNNLGNSIRLVEEYRAEEGSSASINISGDFTGKENDKKAQLIKLQEDFPELHIVTGKEFINSFIGNLTNQIKLLKNIILSLVIGINFLVISLLLRMLISKEVPEIAILKSQGFSLFALKRWQFSRIGIILTISIITGTILANTTGNILASGVFRIMGLTSLQLMIEPWKVYFIYPLLLFTVTMLAVSFSLGQINKTHVWELNNQE